MRFVKRSWFNRFFQPKRIGKEMRRAAVYRGPIKGTKKVSTMQMERRSHQGAANTKYARLTKIKMLITYFIKKNKMPKRLPSFMRKKLL